MEMRVIKRCISATVHKKNTLLTCALIYIPDIALYRRTPMQWKHITINIRSPSSKTNDTVLQVILLHCNDLV